MNRKSTGRDKVFDIIVMIIVGLIAFCFLLPLLNVLASSFSDADAVLAGKVGLFPVDFSLEGYKTVLNYSKIWNGFKNSLIYTLIGTAIQVICQVLCAYPLA